jgi:DNA-binding beta-propeller fold protein YncE
MKRLRVRLVCATLLAAAATGATMARQDRSFQRIGTFANYRNNPTPGDTTVAEIVAASADGRTLVYTDAAMGEIGFIDISSPAHPQPGGKLSVPAGHEPTSVDVLANKYALVAVDSSVSFADPSGYLAVVDLATRTIVHTLALGGQPDSLKISPDGRFAAIAIENERNEDLCVGGTFDGEEVDEDDCDEGGGALGVLPQTPAGYLAVIRLHGPMPTGWTRYDVALTGLAAYAPGDPEPEFVDINHRNHAVVTLQENNHVVVVDLETRTILSHFPAGQVTLSGIDADEDGLIAADDTLEDVAREPDAVAWLPGLAGSYQIATANEGDLFGGSRGFSIFDQSGVLAFDSGASFDRLAMRHGHYPEDRSENKGTEPEAIEYGHFNGKDYLFVGSERGSFIAVYELNTLGAPTFVQLLPAPFGPEGLLAVPHRNLLIASGEEDDAPLGVRSTVMIYELRNGPPTYPQIRSIDTAGMPIGWSALSGMTSVPGDENTLLGVWDGYYSSSRIFRIDVTGAVPAITDATTITGGSGGYDPEGITVAPDNTTWVAVEGAANDAPANRLLQLDAAGSVIKEVGLPAGILACRAASTIRGSLGSGFEGVAAVASNGSYRLFVAQQRGWNFTGAGCEDLDDDAGGVYSNNEPKQSRIWIYDPFANGGAGSWDHIAWELAPRPANAAWVGLSEITLTPAGELVLIERDSRTGDFGVLKTLVLIPPSAWADGLVSASEKFVFDLRPSLTATTGWITDKPEGVAITGAGRLFVVTDNDGVEDWSGESWFLRLGTYWSRFF